MNLIILSCLGPCDEKKTLGFIYLLCHGHSSQSICNGPSGHTSCFLHNLQFFLCLNNMSQTLTLHITRIMFYAFYMYSLTNIFLPNFFFNFLVTTPLNLSSIFVLLLTFLHQVQHLHLLSPIDECFESWNTFIIRLYRPSFIATMHHPQKNVIQHTNNASKVENDLQQFC